ncbi:hypothetical protein DFP83_11431 [Idiomarina fontislapidosi]|uniref:Uncharacterized protein n=1 Tax=Idiomarina fontislapidosi TaxID=263723 RepID=A0A432XQY7_9GAMM|nr:hypothetical protein [Idiomarina fontislapidosi]PYE30715.1 hypothetical protein DFP83_11431 [Idiomarina fontislapidosi]RUO51118.1 hypothetical protein CWE25_11965 [Idiomarina fontislapidosi]
MSVLHPFAKISFDNVVYLGAGIGEELSGVIDQLTAKRWFLVEGDSTKQKKLSQFVKRLANCDKFHLDEAIVSPSGETRTWYNYNLSEFSGLKKAKRLNDLFPGLQLRSQRSATTISLVALLEQMEIKSTQRNLLIINLPGQAMELLESLIRAEKKELFSQVVVSTTSNDAFEDGDTVELLDNFFQVNGYHTRNEPYEDPDFPVLHYSFDKYSAAEFSKLKKELQQALERASEAEIQRDDALKKISATKAEFEKVRKDHEEVVTHAFETKKQLERKISELNYENRSLNKTVEELNKAVANSQNQMMQKLDRLMVSQEQQTKRLETSLGMQQFWQTGEYPELGFGDSVGAGLKKFLVQKMSQENYDVIIQFGVSDCTLFIASVLDKLKSAGRQLTSLDIDRSLSFKSRKEIVTKDTDEYADHQDDASLPAEICVFEHNLNKLNDVKQKANQRQLSAFFSIKHAPLVDYSYHAEDYLHYDSDDAIQQLKQLLEGRKAKLLILVSGPNSAGDERHRFPAIPKVLNAFSKHELHFITDNYHEKGAKEVAVNWSRLFDERGLSLEKHIIADDKPSFAWLVNC